MNFGFGKNDSANEDNAYNREFKISIEDEQSSQETCIGAGSEIEGNNKFTNRVYINGKIKGNIESTEDIIVGPLAEITGNIKAKAICIYGKVIGDLEIQRKASIKRPAEVQGDLASCTIEIEEGAVFNGLCSMNIPGQSDTKTRGEILDMKRPARL